MSKLAVISPGLTGLSYELGSHWVTIGRSDRNAFQIVETSVSSQHCEVLLRGNEVVVRDLRSTNGTFIDGKTVSEAVLKPGQTLRLGQVELHIELSAADPAPADPPAPAPEKKPELKAAGQKIYRVLFVDDSMAFLQMVTDLFESRQEKKWDILTASSPDRALTILQQKLIDLVVLDIGMPLLDGVQLLNLIHHRYPNIKKVVLTGETDDSHRADCLARGAELFLLKPGDEDGWRLIFNMLSSLLQWEDHDDFASSLNDASLYNIIQLECIAGNSSVLEIRNSQTAGEIYIEGGAIIHAAAGKLAGEKAFYQLLSLADGEFRLIPFREPPERSVQVPWESLLTKTVRVQEAASFSSNEDETILITRKRPLAQTTTAPAAAPGPAAIAESPAVPPIPAPAPLAVPETKKAPEPVPAESHRSKIHNPTSGMDFVALEEMVEADTDVIPKPESNGKPPENQNLSNN